MKNIKLSFRFLKFIPFIGLVALCGCVELNDPYNSGGYSSGYSSPSYGSGGYYDDHHKHRDHDRRDWDRERRRLEEERERLRQERERQNHYRPPPVQQQQRCPPGFSPSENKCSHEERRRGCKDMRLSNGLGCVHR